MELAPVYDCGSCLYAQADENIMKRVLTDEKEKNYRIYEIPTSSIMQNGKKVKYFDFLTSLEDEECIRALERIVPRIEMDRIYEIIDTTPFLSDLQKEFYKVMLTERKHKILDYAYEKYFSKEIKVHRDNHKER